MKLNLKALEETRSFYEVELGKEGLTGGERDSFLKALKLVKGFIGEEEAGDQKTFTGQEVLKSHTEKFNYNKERD